MPSHAHQTLLLWGVRRMLCDGFQVTGFEGHIDQAGDLNELPPPFVLNGIRADACGVHADEGIFAFAEAKTASDIDNAHTRRQLRVLGRTRMRNVALPCPLYLAIPRSCAYALDRVLIDVGLIGARHVRRIHVPDVLLLG
jgi:hypothetical protein